MGKKSIGDEFGYSNMGCMFQCKLTYRQFLPDGLHLLCEEGGVAGSGLRRKVKGLTQLWRRMIEGPSLVHKKDKLTVLELGGSWRNIFSVMCM